MSDEYLTQQEKRQKTVKTVISVVVVLAILGLAGWGIVYLGRQDASVQTLTPTLSEIGSNENIWGNPDANTTLIEYGDFQCPACRAYEPEVKQLHADFPDNLRSVFRNFPLPQHPNAPAGAYAAEAAGLQGKFWEMYDLLYTDQPTWAALPDPSAQFDAYATQLGLDIEKFRGDSGSTAIKNKVKADQLSGEQAGVDATPTFYLNGTKVANPATYDQFHDLIAQAVAQ